MLFPPFRISQSEKLGLKDVFFGLYQYQIIKNWSSAGRKVVLFVARKTSLGFYWYFKRQASSRLCRDRFHTHKLSLTGLQWSRVFMNEKKTSFSDWVVYWCLISSERYFHFYKRHIHDLKTVVLLC
jgi:hypothetical protein